MANEALNLKLIDKIGYMDDAYAYVRTALGLASDGGRIVRYDESPSLEKLLASAATSSPLPGPSASHNVNLNGITIDVRQLSQLLSPQPLFLWTGY
jgi:hypothetical protein